MAFWTLAVAQSVYSLLLANPNFLDVRLSSNAQLLGLVAVFNLVPPLVLFLAWLPLHSLRPQWGRALLGMVTFALFLVLFWQVHNLALGEGWRSRSHSYLIWLIPAGLLGLAGYRRMELIRSFGLLLSPFVLVLPVLFLAKAWSTHLDFAAAAEENLRQAVARPAPSDRPAVFFLVFDELSLPVLLDEKGEIDAQVFPHFRTLARESTWFRQATANADYTNQSLPTLLASRFPYRSASLTQRAYPNNLFRLLEAHYDLFLYETWSMFCQPDRYHCLRDSDRLEASYSGLLVDVFYLLAARVAPRGANLQLPDVRRNWGFFHKPEVVVELAMWRFEKFLETVATLEQSRGVFIFFHNSLPHSPYWVTPGGEIRKREPAVFDPGQRGDAEEVATVLARYRGQVRYVDSQLGRFLDLLKQRGLFDSSLLIVTSDHGVSYDLRAPGRDLALSGGEAVNAEPLLRVPLFIKLPRQQEGVVSDREVQLVDIMPTVAEVVGVDLPWGCEGRSVFAPATESRHRVVFDRRGRRYDFTSDPRRGWELLAPGPASPTTAVRAD